MAKQEIKKKFPKTRPLGRLVDTVVDAVAEEVKEVVEEVKAPPVGEVKTLSVTVSPDNKSHIDLGGLTLVDAIFVCKNAHGFLVAEFNKMVALQDGNKEGTANPVSGGNS